MLTSCSTQKTNCIGLWEVEKVSVGNRSMTPVAKWFRINADSTYQTGNGWLQNGNGTWNYDKTTNKFLASDTFDLEDNYGGFAMSFKEGKMTWERVEEGDSVKVTLVAVQRLPMSPADYLKGAWELVEVSLSDQDIETEREHIAGSSKLLFRWDRVYVGLAGTKRFRGYWHMHGHKPEVTLLPLNEEQVKERWRIEVNGSKLTMFGISASNKDVLKKYIRTNKF